MSILKGRGKEPVQWGLAVLAVATYIAAGETGAYREGCLTLLGLVLAALGFQRLTKGE